MSLATGLIYLSITRQKARSPLSDIVKHTALRSGACFLFWECYKICSDQNKICTRIKYNDNYAVFLWLNNCQEVNVQLTQFYASDMAMLHDKYCQMSILNNRNLFVYNCYKEVAMEKNDIRTPHWIHDSADDPNSVTGKKYLVSCTCSECGYHANMEKPVCPQCNAKMK